MLTMEAPTEPSKSAGGSANLPNVTTTLSPEEILARLDIASRRGRLPGFERGSAGGPLFTVEAHGNPFDAVLSARHVGSFQGARLEFSLQLRKRMPVIFALVLAFTVWPGAYFMDEIIAQYLPGLWREGITYLWYLPLTIIPIPFVWKKLMKKARTTTSASAREAIGKIAAEVDGRVEDQPTPR